MNGIRNIGYRFGGAIILLAMSLGELTKPRYSTYLDVISLLLILIPLVVMVGILWHRRHNPNPPAWRLQQEQTRSFLIAFGAFLIGFYLTTSSTLELRNSSAAIGIFGATVIAIVMLITGDFLKLVRGKKPSKSK